MRYLLLIRGDETAAAHADEGCGGWTEELLERGMLHGGGGLRPPAEGKRYAVLVGVRDFDHAKLVPRDYAVNDVAELGDRE